MVNIVENTMKLNLLEKYVVWLQFIFYFSAPRVLRCYKDNLTGHD